MTKKRINGEGNIRKRSVHSWEASLRTEGGVRLYVYGSSQKEAKEKLQTIQAEIANGTYVTENEMTVGDWMDEWYECFTSGVKESSRARYEQDSGTTLSRTSDPSSCRISACPTFSVS